MDRTYEIEKVERVYRGFLSLDEATVRVDGGPAGPRMCLERGDAVGVLLHRPEEGTLIFVRQFRYPTVRHNDPFPFEIVAGGIDPGETPEAAACREVQEETGWEIDEPLFLNTYYSSPGGSSEMLHLFYAAASGTPGQGGGLEGEGVTLEELSVGEAVRKLDAGEIPDGKSQAALLHALRRGLL